MLKAKENKKENHTRKNKEMAEKIAGNTRKSIIREGNHQSLQHF